MAFGGEGPGGQFGGMGDPAGAGSVGGGFGGPGPGSDPGGQAAGRAAAAAAEASSEGLGATRGKDIVGPTGRPPGAFAGAAAAGVAAAAAEPGAGLGGPAPSGMLGGFSAPSQSQAQLGAEQSGRIAEEKARPFSLQNPPPTKKITISQIFNRFFNPFAKLNLNVIDFTNVPQKDFGIEMAGFDIGDLGATFGDIKGTEGGPGGTGQAGEGGNRITQLANRIAQNVQASTSDKEGQRLEPATLGFVPSGAGPVSPIVSRFGGLGLAQTEQEPSDLTQLILNALNQGTA